MVMICSSCLLSVQSCKYRMLQLIHVPHVEDNICCSRFFYVFLVQVDRITSSLGCLDCEQFLPFFFLQQFFFNRSGVFDDLQDCTPYLDISGMPILALKIRPRN